jgi:anthranilate/para-aminobenzoate synthase component II
VLDDMAMAIRDEDSGQLGLQFHPESILTPRGDELVAAILNWARERQLHFADSLAAA